MIWAHTASAQHPDTPGVVTKVGYLSAVSVDEAQALAQLSAQRTFPPSDGWRGHATDLYEVPRHILEESLAQDDTYRQFREERTNATTPISDRRGPGPTPPPTADQPGLEPEQAGP